jgi:archaellum component FlaC
MALTKEDLRQIRGVVDESIAQHPRFDELELKIDTAFDDVLEVMQEGFTMVSQKFEEVDARFDGIDKQIKVMQGDISALSCGFCGGFAR